MARRTGSADLPLHGGSVPTWLAGRMARLGRVLVEALILEYGREEVLRRLADPFWFQALGCIMGMDWHSSGITTSVMGALKRGLGPRQHELGLYICGGRGRHSRATPAELLAVGERTGLDGEALGRVSRLVAKVDSAAVQDGFDLYLHSFVVDATGSWVVIQQGMNPDRRQARRYHWLSAGLRSFVEAPHAAIDGPDQGEILNLTDRRAAPAREAQVALVHRGPDVVLDALHDHHLALHDHHLAPRDHHLAPRDHHLALPARHRVSEREVNLRRLQATLAAAAAAEPRDFPELLLCRGVGARTVQALALVGELLHGTPCRFADPARFSFAHGGKDGHPFPVPLRVYDRTLSVLRRAVESARLGQSERLEALRRLEQQVRRLEGHTTGPGLVEIVARERGRTSALGGRTVDAPIAPGTRPHLPASPGRAARGAQLTLPGLTRRSGHEP